MFEKTKIKALLSNCLGSECIFKVSRYFYFDRLSPYVQAVTYHDTPTSEGKFLKRQLDWYKRNYVNCTRSDLQGLLDKGSWNHEKPGLIISFDDGLRSNLNVALPLLEEYGFTGWFMVPVGFIDIDPSGQDDLAKQGLIDYQAEAAEKRIALSWADLREIQHKGHVVTCHSMNHKRLADSLSQEELENEINDAMKLLDSQLGSKMDIFTWVGGEEWSYCRRAFELMKANGVKYIFCTNCAPITARQSPWLLERYHVEPEYNLSQLRFVLGGFYDLLYAGKRRRVYKRLLTEQGF